MSTLYGSLSAPPRGILDSPDVTVTNEGDKRLQLDKIQALDDDVRDTLSRVSEKRGSLVFSPNRGSLISQNRGSLTRGGGGAAAPCAGGDSAGSGALSPTTRTASLVADRV